MDNDIANARKRMQLEMRKEWTALIMYGIPLHTLAQWRYKGWPNQCIICCEHFDIKIHRWKAFRKITIAGKVFENAVSHMDCFYEMES